jgi:hypothetical protein
MRRGWLSLALAVAVVALVGSVVVAIGASRNPRNNHVGAMMGGAGSGMMGGSGPAGMMGGSGPAGMMGTLWLAGDGTRVASIAAARSRANLAAASQGLRPGEVIWFDNGFYVELKDAAGASATEVIVDPATGAVSTEPGPAMMWNTRYGMHGRSTRGGASPAISVQRAQQIATDWLTATLPGRAVQPADSYPGYYTMETTDGGGTVNGMLSVNATTGEVWYHSWHGRFLAKDDS